MATAAAHTPVTMYPVVEKRVTMASMLVPVCSKNVVKTPNCDNSVMPAMTSTSSESMARSVTTVPNAFGKSVLSYLRNIAQRANSPMRGISKLAAYEIKMA